MYKNFISFAKTYLNEPTLEDVGIGPYEFWGFPGNDKRLVPVLKKSQFTYVAALDFGKATELSNEIDRAMSEYDGPNIITTEELEIDGHEITAKLVLVELHWKEDVITIKCEWEER